MGNPVWLAKFDAIRRKMMSRKITSVIDISIVVLIFCFESLSFMDVLILDDMFDGTFLHISHNILKLLHQVIVEYY